jgi:hypothetical protein
VRSAQGPEDANWRASTDAGESGNGDGKPIVMSANDISAIAMEPSDLLLPIFSPDKRLGQTHVKDMENGQRMRAKVSRKIVDADAANHQVIKFLIEAGEQGAFDEIVACNELSDLIEKRNQEEEEHGNAGWAFNAITRHAGPTSSNHQEHKGSSYNVKVLWEDNSETYELLVEMIKDDPVSCATHAKENDLLKTPGWKALKQIVRREKQFNRMAQQATMQSQWNAVVCKLGIRLPGSRAEAFAFDATNGVTKWQDAVELELQISLMSLKNSSTRASKPKVLTDSNESRIVIFSLIVNRILDTRQTKKQCMLGRRDPAKHVNCRAVGRAKWN